VSAETVAIIGAGLTGCLAGLDLSRRNRRVRLIDARPEPVMEASLWNEGKLHLGYVYAKDAASRTAQRMIEGSLRFGPLIEPWVGRAELSAMTSLPFSYGVPEGSMLTPDQVRAHFAAVAAIGQGHNGWYPGDADPFAWAELTPGDLAATFDPDAVRTAFATSELAIDPHRLAARLREAVQADRNIEFQGDCEVVAARAVGTGYALRYDDGTEETFATVANCTWRDRLRLDATLFDTPDRPWLWRYKTAIHLHNVSGPVPNPATFVLGEYGDFVNFGDGRLYLSWYPACRIGVSRDTAPPDWSAALDDARRSDIFDTTLAELTALMPALRDMDLTAAKTEIEGGIIFNWGNTDIGDPNSETHQRFDVGVRSTGNWHTVDTGKYCLAPLFARELADRIAPQ